uniref:Uncharacterized protein n=1 Tax=Acrobeloides nanus TaxID=290746 RepID=A0A914D0G9_9BILA
MRFVKRLETDARLIIVIHYTELELEVDNVGQSGDALRNRYNPKKQDSFTKSKILCRRFFHENLPNVLFVVAKPIIVTKKSKLSIFVV